MGSPCSLMSSLPQTLVPHQDPLRSSSPFQGSCCGGCRGDHSQGAEGRSSKKNGVAGGPEHLKEQNDTGVLDSKAHLDYEYRRA